MFMQVLEVEIFRLRLKMTVFGQSAPFIMLSSIFLIVLVLSAGGLIFLLVRKMPILAACSVEDSKAPETLTSEAIVAQEKAKLLSRKFLIFIAKKALFSLRGLEKNIQRISEKTRRFYRRQRKKEDIQEDVVKKQEEISKNSNYWQSIRHGLHGRKKKEKIKPTK